VSHCHGIGEPPQAAAAQAVRQGKSGARALAAAVTLTAALTTLYILYARFDTDELQHSHVTWEWTRGLVEYRDVFHNQAPLYHLLMAAPAALAGERPDITILMRLANIPFYLAALGATYLLSRRCFARGTAAWTAAIVAAVPTFLKYGTQFRPDVLWAALLVMTVCILTGARLDWRRGLAAGLVAGVALCTSLKTPVALAAIVCAAGVLPLVRAKPRQTFPLRRAFAVAGAFGAGAVVAPAIMTAFFWRLGALQSMVYCLFEHNAVAGIGRWEHPWQWLLAPVSAAVTIILARRTGRVAGDAGRDGRLQFVVLTAGFFATLLLFAPFVRPQTVLPFVPLVAVPAVGLVAQGAPLFRRRKNAAGAGGDRSNAKPPPWVAFGVVTLGLELTMLIWPPWITNVPKYEAMISDVLALTGQNDYVMDAKGESIFRHRPFYYALERLTTERLERGLMADTIADRLIQTRTCVVAGQLPRLPAKSRSFVRENYLKAGALYVAGCLLRENRSGDAGPIGFDVAIPAIYAVVSESTAANGRLDGAPYTGAVFLEAGRHEWENDGPAGRLAVIWAQAAERGFTPAAFAGR